MALGLGSLVILNLTTQAPTTNPVAFGVAVGQPPLQGRISRDAGGAGAGPFDVAFDGGGFVAGIPVAAAAVGPHLLEVTPPSALTNSTFFGKMVRPTNRGLSGVNDGIVLDLYTLTIPGGASFEVLVVKTVGLESFYYQVLPTDVTILKDR